MTITNKARAEYKRIARQKRIDKFWSDLDEDIVLALYDVYQNRPSITNADRLFIEESILVLTGPTVH